MRRWEAPGARIQKSSWRESGRRSSLVKSLSVKEKQQTKHLNAMTVVSNQFTELFSINLLISDLNKLADGELKILPLKDFWDAKNKKWKQNTYGVFGKQQTARMKRLFGENNFR